MLGAVLLFWTAIVEPWLLKYAAIAPFGVIGLTLWMWSQSDLPLGFQHLTPFFDLAVWWYVGLVVCWVGIRKGIKEVDRLDSCLRGRRQRVSDNDE